ncbi:hypothetical protein QN362_13405 [Actimicrobium sp. CCC2.4]|uniref:hypothetical protein n=1 Tax=Actimicrobium sp. CCC2.4 TaxID=3048606 RepID=UPI002AC9245B|nr:hypothetical protein [Actimicrobium sp. CCC2.4]MEB0136333.1 hypothetical protein [Actimicrobium sp. CCC2.4]WPX31154.1 hypothetical protein RHM62_12960 [Actimicrobium sp. CCC2.4]
MTVAMQLVLEPVSSEAYRVLTGQGAHVGNLKRSQGVWKFKAIGYDARGAVMPGWGPLTDRHNTVLAFPDIALVNALLVPI